MSHFSMTLTHAETGSYAPSSIVAKVNRMTARLDPFVGERLRYIGNLGVDILKQQVDKLIYGAALPPSALANPTVYLQKRRRRSLLNSIGVTQRGPHWVRIGVNRNRLRALSGEPYPYHLALNYGTVRMRPRPFLTEGFRELDKRIREMNLATQFIAEAYR